MNLKYYLNKAKKEKWALGQFNFSTLEQLRGILAAAKKLKSPVILGVSQGELGYLGAEEIIALTEISKMKYKAAAFLNLDHGRDLDLIKKWINFGCSAVHFDGSGFSFEKNIEYAKKVVKNARRKGVLVEGEIDGIGGKKLSSLTETKKFLNAVKADSLAIAIGNKHGCFKNVKLNFKRLKEFKDNTNVFLVLHGGSGISNLQIKKAVKEGIVKINVNTEIRLAWKEGLRKALNCPEIKPYKIMPKVQAQIQKKVEEKIKLFGSNNKI